MRHTKKIDKPKITIGKNSTEEYTAEEYAEKFASINYSNRHNLYCGSCKIQMSFVNRKSGACLSAWNDLVHATECKYWKPDCETETKTKETPVKRLRLANLYSKTSKTIVEPTTDNTNIDEVEPENGENKPPKKKWNVLPQTRLDILLNDLIADQDTAPYCKFGKTFLDIYRFDENDELLNVGDTGVFWGKLRKNQSHNGVSLKKIYIVGNQHYNLLVSLDIINTIRAFITIEDGYIICIGEIDSIDKDRRKRIIVNEIKHIYIKDGAL